MSTLSNIIVTEDDESLNYLMQKILRREGFKTEGALSGADAIDKATSNQYSLLLLDYGLPDMTGKEVIQALSRRKDNVPFMLVTGKGNEHIAVDMMKQGAMDYIIKDDSFIEELPVKVRSVIAALDWKKDVEQAEETLQKRSYFNQIMIERMPYFAIIINPMTNEIIASNAIAERTGILSGRKCASFESDSVTPCPWCNPPALMGIGYEHHTIFEASGKIWDATWMAVDDDIYMVFAADITDRKETYLETSSKKAELKNLADMADGIDQNLNGLKDNMKKLANNHLQMKDKSDK